MSIQRSLQLYKGLVEVSGLLVEVADITELLSAILDVARRVLNAEAGTLFLVTPEGDLRVELTSGKIAAHGVIVPRGQGIAGWSLEHRQCLLVPDAGADPRSYREADRQAGFNTRSLLCAPLLRGEHEIGVLEILNPIDKEAFETPDLEAFEAFANLAATAIDKARTQERRREAERIRQELSLAHEIQRSFLPGSLPSGNGLAFAAHYRAANNISGDFYDVAAFGPDEIFFVIGDVSGRGIPAALLMAQSLSLLRLILRPGISPSEAVRRWNALLCGKLVPGLFITATLGRITPSRRSVELACAGHCAPLLLRAGGVEEISLEGSPPLGLMADLSLVDNPLVLGGGDFLLFYTDGLTESASPKGKLLGRHGVCEALRRRFPSADELLHTLARHEEGHRAGTEPEDDLTLFVFGFR